jgi:hypothetical protein
MAGGTTTSGNIMVAGCVPGRNPTDKDVSCSLIARSRSLLYRSIWYWVRHHAIALQPARSLIHRQTERHPVSRGRLP